MHFSPKGRSLTIGADVNRRTTLVIEDAPVHHRFQHQPPHKILLMFGGTSSRPEGRCHRGKGYTPTRALSIVCTRASFNIAGSSLPRRSALRKIPSQAFALK